MNSLWSHTFALYSSHHKTVKYSYFTSIWSPHSGPAALPWSAPVPPSHTVTMAVTANGQPTLTTPAVACLKIIITDPGVLRNGWWFDAVLTRASNEGSWKFTITPFKCLLMVESAFKHFHIYLRICYATLMCSLTVTLIASIITPSCLAWIWAVRWPCLVAW